MLGERLVGMVGGVQQLQGLVDLLGLHNLIPDDSNIYSTITSLRLDEINSKVTGNVA